MQHDLLYPRPSFAKATEGRSKTRQTYYDFIKFGFVKVFCVFLFFFVFPGKVSAAALTSVSNVPWSSDISVTGKHTVKFTIVTAVPADGKIVINFPSGFTVSSATFDSWSGFDGGRSLSVSGQVVTITRDNTGTSSTAGAKYIVLAGITNNSSAASTYTATVETQDSSSSTLDGVTTSASFSTTATSDGLDTTAPWPMRGHDNRQSFLGTATAPDYPTLAWKFNFIDNDYHDGAVEDSNGIIYINGTTNVYALNTDGSTKWSVAQSRGTSAGTMLTTNSRLVIWYRNGFVESRSISDGSLVWSYASSIGTDAGSLSMGPDGTILIATNSTGMEGINSDGTRKFYNSATSSRDGTPAVDSTTGEIYTFDDGASAGHYPDGTFKWSATGAPGGSVGNPAQLNFSGSIVCGISRSTPNSGSACLNTSNGSNLWSVSTPGGLGISYTQGAWSPDSSIFYTMQNPAFTVSARNATTGVANWTQSYVGGYGYAGSGNLIVDANN
ncbi:MAG: hypothetical protein Q7S31_03700 [bacterium]|nr:hypothetical protein [bacterium]